MTKNRDGFPEVSIPHNEQKHVNIGHRNGGYISCLVWNINGIGDKLGETDVHDIIKVHDVIALIETQKDHSYDVQLPGYTSWHFARRLRHKKAKRASGGFLILIADYLCSCITVDDQTCEYIVWLNIRQHFNGKPRMLYIGIVYVQPEDSTYQSGVDFFECLENELMSKMSRGNVILCGDFNARTAELIDYVIDDETRNEFPPIVAHRHNHDKKINNYGKKLIDVCKHSGIQILNGRDIYSSDTGINTCVRHNGQSAVDYLIANPAAAQYISEFEIKPKDVNSDHCAMTFSVMNKAQSKICPQQKAPTRYIWDIRKQYEYYQSLKDPINIKLYNNFLCRLADPAADNTDIMSYFYQYIVQSLDGVFNKSNGKPNSNFPRNAWFDDDCKELKAEISRARRNNVTTDAITQLTNEYKRILQAKKRGYHHEKARELDIMCTYNPTKYWQFWKSIKANKANNTHIGIDTFTEFYKGCSYPEPIPHFDYVFMTSLTESMVRYSYVDCNINCPDIINDIINGPILVTEHERALKRTKNNKACGEDNIPAEFFKYTNGALDEPLIALFNYIFDSGQYPTAWSTGLINPVYKHNKKCLPENYRKITLLPALSKIFESILNNRLSYCKRILKSDDPLQNGFKPETPTTDNTFILNGIIEKYTVLKRPLYVCFVDFKSAFDHVNRQALLFKMMNQNIKGKMLKIISSMFAKSSSRVKWNAELGEIFDNLYGVLQGGVLSPTLFKIFLEDLPKYLDNSKGVKIGDTIISHLLQADDLVLMSETQSGLQYLLNGLERFCNRWHMVINLLKTNIMVFNSQYQVIHVVKPFKINGEPIPETTKYKYLGTIISNSKKRYKENSTYIRDKAMRAMAGVCSNVRRAVGGELSIALHLKIFDTYVRPILEYGAEVWFQEEQIQELETVQLRYLKTMLRVKRQTSNLAVYGETGRFPLLLRQQDQALKLWCRLQHMEKDKPIAKIYFELEQLHTQGHTTWATKIHNILRKYSLSAKDAYEMPSNTFYAYMKDIRYRQFMNNWFAEINNSDNNPILRTYKLFKKQYCIEPYLMKLVSSKYRATLARFRTSSHSLAIETGRHTSPYTPKEKRICQYCTLNQIDDEVHMLINCTLHIKERAELYASLEHYFPMIVCQSHVTAFTAMMSSKEPHTVACDCIYCYDV